MKNKITRHQAEKVYNQLTKKLKHIKKIELCGSYRRGEPYVGDLDLVVVPYPGSEDLARESISKLGEVLVSGQRTIRIMVKGQVQVDFMIVKEEHFESAVLHSTGSTTFNIRCRAIAKKLGYKLNEYGLTNQNNPQDVTLTEVGILAKLKMMDHVDPRTRN